VRVGKLLFRARAVCPGRAVSSRKAASDVPAGVAIEAQYSDISDVIDRKAAGVRVYASQLPRLFDSEQQMLDDLYGYHSRVALAGGVSGYAERYWSTVAL